MKAGSSIVSVFVHRGAVAPLAPVWNMFIFQWFSAILQSTSCREQTCPVTNIKKNAFHKVELKNVTKLDELNHEICSSLKRRSQGDSNLADLVASSLTSSFISKNGRPKVPMEDVRDTSIVPADLCSRDLKVVDVGGGTGYTTLGIMLQYSTSRRISWPRQRRSRRGRRSPISY